MKVATISELRDAMARARAGDEIVLGDGTYALETGGYLATSASGTSQAPIRMRAANPRKAVIESNGAEEAIRITRPFWFLEDLVIRATRGSTYAVKLEGDAQGSRVLRSAIEVQVGSECGIKGAGNANGPCPDRVVVQDCVIMMPTPTTYMMAEGIDVVACHGWAILKNHIEGFKTLAGGVAFGIMAKGNAKNTRIEENIVHDCFIGISLGGGGTGKEWIRDGDTTYEARNGLIQSNIIANSTDVSMYLYSANGTRVLRNSCFSSYTSLNEGGSSIDVRVKGSTAAIVGNILDKKIRDRDGGVHQPSGNLYLPSRAYGRTIFFPA